MSPYALTDVILLSALLAIAVLRFLVILFHPDCITVRPPLLIYLLTLAAILLPIFLLRDETVSNPMVEIFYGVVTVPMTALLLYTTGRESFRVKDFFTIIYTPPFFGKALTFSDDSVRAFAVGPKNEILLVLKKPLSENGETVIGSERGVGFVLYGKLYATLIGCSIDEITYDEAKAIQASERKAAGNAAGRLRRRETASYLRAIGLTLVYLLLAVALFLGASDLSTEAFPLPSIVCTAVALLLFLVSFFLAERQEKR